MAIGITLSLLSGCGKAEKWVSEKADETLAHEIESAADELADGKNHPSGVPNRKKKSKRPDDAPSASADVAAESAPTPAPSAPSPP